MINKDEALEIMSEEAEPILTQLESMIQLASNLGRGFIVADVGLNEPITYNNHKFIMWKLSMLGYNVTLHDDLSAITISWF